MTRRRTVFFADVSPALCAGIVLARAERIGGEALPVEAAPGVRPRDETFRAGEREGQERASPEPSSSCISCTPERNSELRAPGADHASGSGAVIVPGAAEAEERRAMWRQLFVAWIGANRGPLFSARGAAPGGEA